MSSNKKYIPKIAKLPQTQSKTYTYSLPGVELKFTLRVDIKTEIVNFKALMVEAIKDLDIDLEKF